MWNGPYFLLWICGEEFMVLNPKEEMKPSKTVVKPYVTSWL